jgi:acyl carrier protein
MEGGISPETVLDLVAAEAGIPPSDLAGESSLSELGVSSFRVMRLLLALEEEFDVVLSAGDLIEATKVPVGRLPELLRRVKAATSD